MLGYEILKLDHLELDGYGYEAKDKLREFALGRILDFETSCNLLPNLNDKAEFIRLSCLIENKRNEITENIKGFDFEIWIEQYESAL